MLNLSSKYDFNISEAKSRDLWQKLGVYLWDSSAKRSDTFVVDTPPPTVSGTLHMGHIFSYAHADFVVRFMRMRGKNIFYPIGFDDNGLPTERLVEKKMGIKASQMPRKQFSAIYHDVVAKEEEKFREFFNSIGLSVDWNLEYQTISKYSQKISQMSFLDLAQKNQLYRSDQPMIWDPVDQTALAQAEIEDKERESLMNYIIFKTENGEELTIATTRPELIPACVAVFYHPDDKRYSHLCNQFAVTPLFNNKVQIIPDDAVLMDKGTGLVMCSTFGDNADILWWRKHKLPLKIIISKAGKITNLDELSIYSKELENLSVKDARSKILEILKIKDLLVRSEVITQVVKCAERSGAPLEIITTKQWFIKTIEHKDALLKLSSELEWHPKSMKIRLDSWINSLFWDWCISRQRFCGVKIPVWYSKRLGEEGKPIFPSIDQLPIDPTEDLPYGYTREELEADSDVMDTWATSAVSPQLSSYAISEDFAVDFERHQKLFPGDLRPQAHEIIRVWTFYTILKSYLHQTVLPWKNIMISGWCLAEDKTKMSKSKGNAADPTKLIETYGADAVRYWAASARLGADTAYSEDVVKNGKRLLNKMWNAARFVAGHLANLRDSNIEISCTMDKWLISRLRKTIDVATTEFEKFEYANALSVVEEFFWKDFCDNYLEISKSRAYNENGSNNIGQQSAIATLNIAMNMILRLFAPFLPYITEEIYQGMFAKDRDIESVHAKNMWPKIENYTSDAHALTQGGVLIEILNAVRKAKADKNLSIKADIEYLEFSSSDILDADILEDLRIVTSTKDIKNIKDHEVSIINIRFAGDDD